MGYRGYIGSRFHDGRSVPQNVQQLVIRDYCQRNGFEFLLSATEYCMPESTMMLDAILQEENEGIIMYSIGLLPRKRYDFKKPIHFAAENRIFTPDVYDTRKLGGIIAGSSILTRLAHFNAA